MSQDLKRFYKAATVDEAGGCWQVVLDGRPVRTPGRALQKVPTQALAIAMAKEWDRQGERIDIARMHLTRLANVALDRTPDTRSALAEEVARYCETDLTCHLDPNDSELRSRQEAAWQPLRAWSAEALGVALRPVEGIMPAAQPDASLEAARAHAAALDDFRLTGLVYGCGLFGSAILALAVERGHIEAGSAFEASLIDAAFQAERWGEDSEAKAAEAERRLEAEALGDWFAALSAPP
ncbi:MAG: ATP12 family protein [Pseudomonadota bacterium]